MVVYIPTAVSCRRIDKGPQINNLYQLKKLGYYVDIVELAALKPDVIKSALEDADAIFVGGGDCFYLSYWMQKTGLFELLPKLLETKVYAGVSAGSMIVGGKENLRLAVPNEEIETISDVQLNEYGPANESSSNTLQLVDFLMKVHLNSPGHLGQSDLGTFTETVSKIDSLIYVIDNQTAIKVIDDKIEVISEGEWHLLNS
ncbi:MAG TPA: Type 1 glutamine amidotransferase-like domain-containing protein [Candidatus Saccharimonadales bacterium]|nr:Type 1 glutamine amidotransferase-like domain-containing protein [Candidatus Saccharimonadales bacterium]